MNFHRLFQKGALGDSLALFAGILMTFAFAPFTLWPLAIFSLALLAGLWLDVPTRIATRRGFLFGIGLFGTGVSWVYISMHTFGNLPAPLAGLITILFTMALACFPMLAGGITNRILIQDPDTGKSTAKNRALRLFIAFPASWVFMEWVRSWFLTGFPWLTVGYSQINSPLRGFAPLQSVYGVSLAVAYSSALIVGIILALTAKKYRLFLGQCLLLIVLWSIGALLTQQQWTKPQGKPIRVALVQGNIPQSLKWQPDQLLATLQTYTKLSAPYWQSHDVIIWPESAIPFFLQDVQAFVNQMDALAKKNHAALITGILVNQTPNTHQTTQPEQYYNAVIALGTGNGFYLKRHLVPFGEFIPFESVLHHALDILHIPLSQFVAGKGNTPPLLVGNNTFSPFICHEIAFPEQVRSTNSHIHFLVTVSNDAWFGRSFARAQHLEMAQMRALELGRTLLFVGNNGLTAVINARGEIQRRLPPDQAGVLTDTVQPMHGETPWQIAGLDPLLMLLSSMFLILFFIIQRQKRQQSHGKSLLTRKN